MNDMRIRYILTYRHMEFRVLVLCRERILPALTDRNSSNDLKTFIAVQHNPFEFHHVRLFVQTIQ
ncbi:hypothetical protein A8E97_32775 [Burkholderia cenocepacia]|nr:hypothetical protein A8E88_31240 [Burkholderia cenocepacia]KOR21120.1 hypothetical protein ABW54_13295 [Burkholderia cenocepacia]ONV97388.1 hypothetical protein A8E89_06160 [Burkholderia cenocepacia]ONW05009.1 hypothetical protein A8E94_31435 [Burkholderia cenocepacia]ONW26021.1 hypothetical protein A8E90_01540 [Burkholderia cenocepacia]